MAPGGGGAEVVAGREQLGPRGEEHGDGRRAEPLDQAAQEAHAVGAGEVDVLEDQEQRAALGVDLEEPAEHRAGDVLGGARVFEEGLREQRRAEAHPQEHPEEMQDLVDPPVAEEVHHLGADLVGLGVGVAGLVEAEARAEDPRDGRVGAAVRAGGAAVDAQHGLVDGQVGRELVDEAGAPDAGGAHEGHRLAAGLAHRPLDGRAHGGSLGDAADEGRAPDRQEVVGGALGRGVGHRGFLHSRVAREGGGRWCSGGLPHARTHPTGCSRRRGRFDETPGGAPPASVAGLTPTGVPVIPKRQHR